MKFAKLFGDDNDQVLVLLDTDEDDNPSVTFYCHPEDFGVCHATISFTDDNNGEAWDKAGATFDALGEQEAREFCRKLISDQINEARRH